MVTLSDWHVFYKHTGIDCCLAWMVWLVDPGQAATDVAIATACANIVSKGTGRSRPAMGACLSWLPAYSQTCAAFNAKLVSVAMSIPSYTHANYADEWQASVYVSMLITNQ